MQPRDAHKKGTTEKIKISQFTDFDEQIVYIEVLDPAESKSGLIIELDVFIPCHFVKNKKKKNLWDRLSVAPLTHNFK